MTCKIFKKYFVPSIEETILVILICIISWTITWFVCRHNSASFLWNMTMKDLKDRHEMYKNSSLEAFNNFVKWYNNSNMNGSLLLSNSSLSRTELCIGIMSNIRPACSDRKYLTQCVMSLVTRLSNFSTENRVSITIFNNDNHPEHHHEANNLSKYFKVVYPQYPPDINPINSSWSFKEAVDYIFVMDYMYNQGCPYVLILEDDALAAKDWFIRIQYMISDALKKYKSESWLMMKLFMAQLGVGWFVNHGWDEVIVIFLGLATALIALILVTSFISLTHYYITKSSKSVSIKASKVKMKTKNFKKSFYKFIKYPTVSSLIFLSVNFSFIYILAGKANVFPEPKGISHISSGYSFVANLYQRENMNRFKEFFLKKARYYANSGGVGHFTPKDLYNHMFMNEDAPKYGIDIETLVTNPRIFQHTGIHSSLEERGTRKNLELFLTTHLFPDDEARIEFHQ